MPITKASMIRDLVQRTARGFRGAGTLGASSSPTDTTLHAFYRVMMCYTPITVTPGDTHFQVSKVTPPAVADGHYLWFEDGWSTVATLTRNQPIVVGGGYSGCLYSVYHAGAGVYKCVHTARPSGVDSETFVGGLRAYAQDQGWTLVHEVTTVTEADNGIGINGCVTTFLATRVDYTINPSPMVRTVRLRQDNLGDSVGQHRYETATP